MVLRIITTPFKSLFTSHMTIYITVPRDVDYQDLQRSPRISPPRKIKRRQVMVSTFLQNQNKRKCETVNENMHNRRDLTTGHDVSSGSFSQFPSIPQMTSNTGKRRPEIVPTEKCKDRAQPTPSTLPVDIVT